MNLSEEAMKDLLLTLLLTVSGWEKLKFHGTSILHFLMQPARRDGKKLWKRKMKLMQFLVQPRPGVRPIRDGAKEQGLPLQ